MIIHGREGSLTIGTTAVSGIESWSLHLTTASKAYVANNTGGWEKSLALAQRGEGSFSLLLDSQASCPLAQGETVTLELAANTGDHYQLTALVMSTSLTVDVRGGNVLRLQVTFRSSGVVTSTF